MMFMQEAKTILDGKKLGDTRQETKAQKPNVKRLDTMQKAQAEGRLQLRFC